jgi:hypothetical protein
LWLNVRFLARDSWSATDVAGNLAHEWMHQLGFEHAWRHEPGREHTVPYAIGTLVERLAR